MILNIKLKPNSKPPIYTNEYASCADVFANLKDYEVLKCISRYNMEVDKPIFNDGIDICIPIEPLETVFIPTGIAVELPIDYVIDVYARSGKSAIERKMLANAVGKIDCDYRGDIMIPIMNISNGTILIKHHEKLAQVEIRRCNQVEFNIVETLTTTIRGENGFGSSGD